MLITSENNLVPVVLTVLLSSVVLGGTGYYLANNQNATDAATVPSNSSASSVKTFPSSALHLAVDLPSGWTIKEREDIKGEVYVLELYQPSPRKDAAGAP